MSFVFQIVGRSNCWSLYVRMLGKGLLLKTTTMLVFFLVFNLQKCGLLSYLEYSFRSFESTADLLTVVSDRIATAFKISGAMPDVALDIFKVFNRVGNASPLHKLSFDFKLNIWLGLNSYFLSNKQFHVVLDEAFSQEYPV